MNKVLHIYFSPASFSSSQQFCGVGQELQGAETFAVIKFRLRLQVRHGIPELNF
jgi:hypothetical protein